MGPAGGPFAPADAHTLVGAAAQLAAGVAVGHHGRVGRHGLARPTGWVNALGGVRFGGGLCLGHTRHCAGRVSHRVGRCTAASGAGRELPNRLPLGHDLGRGRCAVDRRPARGHGSKWLPTARLASRLLGDGRVHGGGFGDRGVFARACAGGDGTRAQSGRVAAVRRGRPIHRLLDSPPLAWCWCCRSSRCTASATW